MGNYRIKEDEQAGQWKGSAFTAGLVMAQIEERWGKEEAEKYNPETNCFTYETWKRKGFQVQKGETGLKSHTFKKMEKLNEEGEVKNTFTSPRKVTLFYYLQVKPIKSNKELETCNI